MKRLKFLLFSVVCFLLIAAVPAGAEYIDFVGAPGGLLSVNSEIIGSNIPIVTINWDNGSTTSSVDVSGLDVQLFFNTGGLSGQYNFDNPSYPTAVTPDLTGYDIAIAFDPYLSNVGLGLAGWFDTATGFSPDGGQTFDFFAYGSDEKSTRLLEYVGLPTDLQWNFTEFVISGLLDTDFAEVTYYLPTSINVYNSPSPPAVPEPATMLLLGSGLVGLAGLGRRKFFKKG